MDRGYFSRGNIRYLDECGYSFVIMAKGMSSFISDLILENKGTFENKRSCDMNAYGVYGKTVQRTLFEGDEKRDTFIFIIVFQKMLMNESILKTH